MSIGSRAKMLNRREAPNAADSRLQSETPQPQYAVCIFSYPLSLMHTQRGKNLFPLSVRNRVIKTQWRGEPRTRPKGRERKGPAPNQTERDTLLKHSLNKQIWVPVNTLLFYYLHQFQNTLTILIFLKIQNIHRREPPRVNQQFYFQWGILKALQYPLWRVFWDNCRLIQEWFKSNCPILKSFFRLPGQVHFVWLGASSSSTSLPSIVFRFVICRARPLSEGGGAINHDAASFDWWPARGLGHPWAGRSPLEEESPEVGRATKVEREKGEGGGHHL